MTDVFVVGARRTPIGAFEGTLSSVSATDLGAVAIRSACESAGVPTAALDHVLMGNVLQAGVGPAPARQAMIKAGVPAHVPAVTLNKVCGSGLAAVIDGARLIRSGEADLVVVGGMESMSNVPFQLPSARRGLRLGHAQLRDGLLQDGLWDPTADAHMGMLGERCAEAFGLSRADQDSFARRSYERARAAQAAGSFSAEIVPVELTERSGSGRVRGHIDVDEEPGRVDLDKLTRLRPAFKEGGTITAGNASSIDDGAAALVLASRRAVERHELTVLGRMTSHAAAALPPEDFASAPIPAIQKALDRAGLRPNDVDLYEINEAFAVVPIAAIKALDLDDARVNVRGGAVALGHPIGASGARIVVTLVHAMAQRHARRGIASICIGGGEALTVVLERNG